MSPVPAIRFIFRLKVIGLFGANHGCEPDGRLSALAGPADDAGELAQGAVQRDIAASGHAIPLETSLEDIGHVGFTGHDGKPTTIGHALPATSTDAFIVLRRGRIAAEWYAPA